MKGSNFSTSAVPRRRTTSCSHFSTSTVGGTATMPPHEHSMRERWRAHPAFFLTRATTFFAAFRIDSPTFFTAPFFFGGLAPFGKTMTRLPSNATTISRIFSTPAAAIPLRNRLPRAARAPRPSLVQWSFPPSAPLSIRAPPRVCPFYAALSIHSVAPDPIPDSSAPRNPAPAMRGAKS